MEYRQTPKPSSISIGDHPINKKKGKFSAPKVDKTNQYIDDKKNYKTKTLSKEYHQIDKRTNFQTPKKCIESVYSYHTTCTIILEFRKFHLPVRCLQKPSKVSTSPISELIQKSPLKN